MKRLIWSDMHLHPFAYGATVTEGEFNSRLYAQYLAAEEMIEDAQNQGVEYAYCCGDVFHQHGMVSSQALMLATRIFDALRAVGIKVRAVPGNHDQSNRSGSIHSLSWLAQDEISGSWVDGGLQVRGLPYTASEDVLRRFLEDAELGLGGMVLLHQGVAGVPLASGHMLDERLSPEMIPGNVVAFTGHYHFFKRVDAHLTVVGNLTPINWGDIDQPKGWVIWDDETGVLEHRLQTKAPAFISWSKSIAKHSDLANVQNAFVRYTDAVSLKQQEKIRAELKDAGALTVEFPTVKLSKKQSEIRSGDTVTIEHLAKQFEEGIEGRRLEVGVEVREGKYNAN